MNFSQGDYGYQITTAGRRQLARETASWRRFADAIQLVLQFA